MKIIRNKALRAKLGGISNATLYRWMEHRGLPKPFTFGGGVAWDEDAIDAWIVAEIAREATKRGPRGE